jgi:hypothetical protein
MAWQFCSMPSSARHAMLFRRKSVSAGMPAASTWRHLKSKMRLHGGNKWWSAGHCSSGSQMDSQQQHHHKLPKVALSHFMLVTNHCCHVQKTTKFVLPDKN